jgi:N-methylhydantoinase B
MSPSAASRELDLITVEIIRAALKANLDEVERTLCRTAYSSTIYEVRDMCAGWLDADRNLIAQGRYGLPIFVGDLGLSIGRGVEVLGQDSFREGDVIITNHAASCGHHLNNVVVYSPVFVDGSLVGFTVTRAHWADVGGKAVGSISTDSTEIFQEGVQFDNLRIMRGGEWDPQVSRMIEANVRFPDQALGDLRAQITACRLGERRLAEMAAKYGIDLIRAAITHIWDQSEARARMMVRAIPNGTYRASSFMDNDGVVLDEHLNIEVAVTVEDDAMTIDLAGTHRQATGPMNCGIAGAVSACRVAFKALTSPGTTADEGAFRPLNVKVPPGTFVSAEPPAPLAQWSTMLATLIETVLTALAPAIPERIPAAHLGDFATCFISRPSVSNRPGFVHADPFPGGWGARPHSDGPVTLKSYGHGDTPKISAELEESSYPFRVLAYELRQDSGGAGRYRGGLGIDRTFEFLEDLQVTTSLERSECLPWGLFGGGPGGAPVATLRYPDGRTEQFHKATAKPVPAGSRLTISTGGGGGYGWPSERPPERVLSDVRAGYVSSQQARAIYRVVVVGSGPDAELDSAKTERLRSSPPSV